jgi:hypothetical protein
VRENFAASYTGTACHPLCREGGLFRSPLICQCFASLFSNPLRKELLELFSSFAAQSHFYLRQFSQILYVKNCSNFSPLLQRGAFFIVARIDARKKPVIF